MIIPTLTHEQQLWQAGYNSIVGLDEVGRGAWAGPVVVGAAIWNKEQTAIPKLVRDSKLLSPLQRQTVVEEIKQLTTWHIGQATVDEINQLGIAAATFLAMERAWQPLLPDFILIDAFTHPAWAIAKQRAVIKGDAHVASIAAASILAKIHRDQLMDHLDAEFPEYGLAQHKGYGTAKHQQAIQTHGLATIHRTGFKLKFLG